MSGPVAPRGFEFLVNTFTPNAQQSPAISRLANGNFVVTWDSNGAFGESNAGISAQIFTATGAAVGGEFHVNTITADAQRMPTIGSLSNGGFLVAWVDAGGSLGDQRYSAIDAQVFSADGVKVGSEFRVNTQVADVQSAPTVTGLANGSFVVSWYDGSRAQGDGSGSSVKAQLFGAGGAMIGGEFLVNTFTQNNQRLPSIAPLADGGFVVSYVDLSQANGDTTGDSIAAQILSAAGAKVGSQILVNTQTSGNQSAPSVAGLRGGGFVVAWQDINGDALGDGNGLSIKAQAFNGAGAKSGAEFLVNSQISGNQRDPSVAALSDGGFVVTWTDESTAGDGSGTSVKGQAYDAAGARAGGEFLVDSQTASNQTLPRVTGLDTGFAVAWEDASGTLGDTSMGSIKAQIFGFQEGTPGPDTILLLGRDDVFSGLAGNDLIYGNQGRDLVYGNQGNDTVFGGQDNDTAFGGQNDDAIYGNLGSDAIYGNLGSDAAFGGQGNDLLFGGQGDDTLSGNLGNDTLTGGLGADRYVFGGNGGVDLVIGFSQADGDKLDFGGQTYTLDPASPDSARFFLSGGGTVELLGVSSRSVNPSYFA